MKSIIIGTAGHIDHGKTALVKALSGIDADPSCGCQRTGFACAARSPSSNFPRNSSGLQ